MKGLRKEIIQTIFLLSYYLKTQPHSKNTYDDAGGDVQECQYRVFRLEQADIFSGEGGEGGVAAAKAGDEEKFEVGMGHLFLFEQSKQDAYEEATEDIRGEGSEGEGSREISSHKQRCQVAKYAAESAAEAYEDDCSDHQGNYLISTSI